MTDWAPLIAAGEAWRQRHFAAYRDPDAALRTALASVLQALEGSRFAAEHGLHAGLDLAAYRRAVPVRRYEDFRPWLDPLIDGEAQALSGEAPVAFELTGGSTGGRKPLPLTPALMLSFQRGLAAWMADLALGWPGVQAGRAYFAVSPALRVAPPPLGAWPVGLPSDLAYFGDLAPAMAPLLLFAPEIAAIDALRFWQEATLALMLGAEDLSLISVWSPSFLTGLLDALAARPEAMLRALSNGVAGVPPNPARARALERSELAPSAVWPNLSLISAWADASSAAPFADLARAMPGVAMQGKGLLATEGLFTLPFREFADPVPASLSAVLEFRDDEGAVHAPQALTEGETYDLIASPIGGLPRYLIGDRLRCTGWAMPGVPMLRFVGRGGSATDLAGEKLPEAFVLSCLESAGLAAILVAVDGPPARYCVVLKAAALPAQHAALEAALRQNPQYALARDLGQLGPLQPLVIPDAAARLRAHRLRLGHRLSDVKPPVLLSQPQVYGLLDQYLMESDYSDGCD